MKTIDATVTSQGRITIPVEIRRRLGLEKGSRVRFVVDDAANVRLTGAGRTLASLRGSVPPIPGMSDDFDQEIEEAMGDALVERYPWTLRE